MKNFMKDESAIVNLKEKLKGINLKLWDIEDGKRNAEKNNEFGKEFIELARNVYKFNDERAKIKSEINLILNSNIREVKSHFQLYLTLGIFLLNFITILGFIVAVITPSFFPNSFNISPSGDTIKECP